MTGGMFDGFEDYRTATEDDYRRTLTGGMVVFDANVLLNLYRFNSTTRADLIKVMQSLGDSLWIPHQVMREFWRNRESVIDQLGETPRESLAKLDKARQDAEEAVRAWSNRIYLPEGERDGLLTRLNGAFQAVRHTISEQAAANAHPHDTNADTIVATLSSILGGRTGAALPPEDHDAAVVEAERRIVAKEPPGYLDKDKADADERAGDFLVWKQVLLEAERRSCDVLLVTSDVKDDWWRRAKGQLRGPRWELMAEFRRSTGHRLFMITPSELIRRADALTDVHVNPESAENIERVENIDAEPVPHDVARELVLEIDRRMAQNKATTLTSSAEHRAISEWLDDPDIGGVLDDYFHPTAAREWIEKTVLRPRLSALYGVGPHAELVSLRFQSADEIIDTVCGTDWRVEPGTLGIRPYNCIATNGVDRRYVCWGFDNYLNELLTAATQQQTEGLGRPLIVFLHLGTLPDREYLTAELDKVGVDAAYLKRELRPNPDYVG
ncbi:PIN-like domain-containing protein [Nocardia sp. NRRL S-836]|uniref:PIN-like domain-containing protein n=1 Tax=Nocardia sp. NRRL S-836 TaxID=1519492 RepID=UPI0012FA9E56|nr:PIN-like domain-containing protein [Nocardia sp. NRRL S-836]